MERLGLYLGRHAGMGGGIGVYLRALLHSYLKLPSSAEIPMFELLVYGDAALLTPDFRDELFALRGGNCGDSAVQSLAFCQLSSGLGRKCGVLSDQLELAIRLRRDRVTLLHSVANIAALWAPCPQLVTVHDLFQAWPPEGPPGYFSLFYRALFAAQFPRVSAVVSDLPSVRDEVRSRYRLPASKVSCVLLGVDQAVEDWAQRSRLEARSEFETLPERFVLLLASSNPRKNTRGMIEAWRRFAAQDHTLDCVVLCQDDAVHAELAHAKLPRLQLLRSLSRERFAALLRAADILLFASHAEGFGLPVLEMLRCGGAVVCSPLEVTTMLEDSEGVFFCEARRSESIVEALALAADRAPQASRPMRTMAEAASETIRLCLSLSGTSGPAAASAHSEMSASSERMRL